MNRDLERILFTPYFSFNEFNSEKLNNSTSKTYYNEEDFKKYDPHRIFTHKQKEECWKMVSSLIIFCQAEIVSGRNPDRWRYDAVGNLVLKALRGCNGSLCHEYDHILPHSKGGETRLSNCQILQTRVNRLKGSSINMSDNELKNFSLKVELSNTEMDLIEKLVFGEDYKESKSRKKSKAKNH